MLTAISGAKSTDGKIINASATALSSAQTMLTTAKGYRQQSDPTCTAANG